MQAQLVADGQGYYVVRVEFAELVPLAGFLAARQEALGYGAFLQEALNENTLKAQSLD